jgi:hypothetical protein
MGNLKNKDVFKVLTAVLMKRSIFWDTRLCSPLEVNGSFGGICQLNLQGLKVNEGRNHHETNCSCCLLHAGFLLYSSTQNMKVRCSSEKSIYF